MKHLTRLVIVGLNKAPTHYQVIEKTQNFQLLQHIHPLQSAHNNSQQIYHMYNLTWP